ncbi:hypothetical protein LIER_09561 [Lithospermum erythrorhizon]|uniref:Serpin domain-containing protein n=1 Tax=Lithospermum erythrorhizon TaxID=34254 RepID=A0AAV3PHB6_LITER
MDAEVIKEVDQWKSKLQMKPLAPINEVVLAPPEFGNSNTRLIFANALYFKGASTAKFDSSKTKDDGVYLLTGSCVKILSMTNKGRILQGSEMFFKC